MITVDWQSHLHFQATTPSGQQIPFDGNSADETESKGASPMETLLAATAACSAMDVISILEKKKQVVTGYRIEIDGERTEQGVFPRPFKSMTIRHIVQGVDVDPIALARAVELSDEKYCSVVATLRTAPKIVSEWAIEEALSAR